MRYETEWDYEDVNFKTSKGGDSEYIRRGIPGEAVVCQPLQVKVSAPFDGECFGRALKAFRAITQKEKVVSNLKMKQSFEKPSDKRRRKQKEANRKEFEARQKQMRMEQGFRKKPKKLESEAATTTNKR